MSHQGLRHFATPEGTRERSLIIFSAILYFSKQLSSFGTKDFNHSESCFSIYPKNVDKCYAAGANLYVKKPVTYSEIKEVFVKIFELDWKEYNPQPPFTRFCLE